MCCPTEQDHLCEKEPGITDDLHIILTELTTLNKTENSKVALRARQVSYHYSRVFYLVKSFLKFMYKAF